METLEVVLKLEELFLLESIPTADDPQRSLQQQDLSGGLLLQDQQQVPSVSKAQIRRAKLVFARHYWRHKC